MYSDRIKKPIDIVKQPWLDCERAVCRVIYRLLKSSVNPRPYPDSVKKLLLIRRNRLGDAVNVLPVIDGIKQYRPDLEIHVLANHYNAEIFRHNAHVDQLHVIDEKWRLGKFSLFCHPVLKALRQETFDLVIGLGGYSSVLAQLVYWVKGRYNIGVVSKKGTFYDFCYDLGLVEQAREDKHHVDDMAYIVRSAGLQLPDILPFARMRIDSIRQKKCLAICPDVKRTESRYPVEFYARAVEELLQAKDIEQAVLFTSSPNSPYRNLEKSGVRWCPTSNVAEFVREVAKCEWAISAEGGSAHIAGALGLGVVVLSGMGHQNYWRPYAEHVEILENKQGVIRIGSGEVVAGFRRLGLRMRQKNEG